MDNRIKNKNIKIIRLLILLLISSYVVAQIIDGSNAENNSPSSNQITPMRSQNLEDIFTPSQEIRADEEIVFPVDI
ncbi:MAG: hypothetical protein ACO2ZB_04200 [Gammaproteobacteria bacterium]|jgi:hypothetical protein